MRESQGRSQVEQVKGNWADRLLFRQKLLQQQRRRDLIGEFLPFAVRDAVFAQPVLGGEGGESFVAGQNRAGNGFSKAFDKLQNVIGGMIGRPVEPPRQSDHDAGHVFLGDDLGNPRDERLRVEDGERGEGPDRQPEFVADGEAGPLAAPVDRERATRGGMFRNGINDDGHDRTLL